jgi:putative phosphoribosyl transferase
VSSAIAGQPEAGARAEESVVSGTKLEQTDIGLRNRRGLRLAASWLTPASGSGPWPAVAFAHGWGSGKASPRNLLIAENLVEHDIAALLVDFSGHGESEGRADDVTLEDQQDDLRTAIDWLATRDEIGRIGVAGSSSGAAVAAAEAVGDARVDALVLRAPSQATRRMDLARLAMPTLVIQGDEDPLLGRTRELVKTLTCENRLVVVPGAGHLFEEEGVFDDVVRETRRWFARWLAGRRVNAGGERELGHVPVLDCAGGWGRSIVGRFIDRTHAGRQLADRLDRDRGAATVVLALPRGGVLVGEPIAVALGAALDVIVARKLRAPTQPELAIGAIAEGHVCYWNDDIVHALALTDDDRQWELERASVELAEHVATYRAVQPQVPVAGHTVILVDDGVATGATLRAAIAAVVQRDAARLVVALPGGPRDTLEEIDRMSEVDELVVLAVPEPFYAVGQLYESFRQVSSDEVCAALRRSRERLRRSAHAAA